MAELDIKDLRRLLGDASDAQLMQIIALKPTASEVEQAAAWLNREGDRLDQLGHPLAGTVGLIFDILNSDEDEP